MCEAPTGRDRRRDNRAVQAQEWREGLLRPEGAGTGKGHGDPGAPLTGVRYDSGMRPVQQRFAQWHGAMIRAMKKIQPSNENLAKTPCAAQNSAIAAGR